MDKRGLISLLVGVFGLVGTFILIFVVISNQHEKDQEYSKMHQYYLQQDALLAMQQGDNYLLQGNYEGAINQYNIALALDTSNDKIRLQVAKAHKKQCIEVGEGCEDALLIFNLLIENYSYDIEMIQERLELHQHLGDSAGVKEDRKLLKEIDYNLQFR